MSENKKISLAEALIMVLFNLFGDAIDAMMNLIGLVPVIGISAFALAPFFSAFFFAVTEFWLIIRGGVSFRQQLTVVMGNLADIMPFLGALPFKTVCAMVAIYMTNHPQIASVVSGGLEKIKTTAESAAEAVEPAEATPAAAIAE